MGCGAQFVLGFIRGLPRDGVKPHDDNGKEKSRALESDQADFHFPCCGFIETRALDNLRIVAPPRRGGRWEVVKS
jgi:hypothetical protein